MSFQISQMGSIFKIEPICAKGEAGSGSGLALHGTMLAVVGGELVVEEGGEGVRVSV